MKKVEFFLCLLMVTMTSAVIAQKKGEMPFTSSAKEANKSLRKAWVALADFKVEEGNQYMRTILDEDPDCGMCYASLFPFDDEEGLANLRKASAMKLSADEKMFIDGVIAQRENRSNDSYFEPLIRKYPTDSYLHLWIIVNNTNRLRAIELGENLIKRNAKLAPAYNLLGYLYMNQNDMTKAEMYFDRYLALQPDLANPYDSKGDFMMQAGKVEEAITLYQKAVALGMKASIPKLERAKLRLEFPKPSTGDATALEELTANAFRAYEDRDLDALMASYSDQCVYIFPDQRANVGRANLLQAASEAFTRATWIKNRFKPAVIDGVGPIAVALGASEWISRPNNSGAETPEESKVIYLYRKGTDGKWKILANHFYDQNKNAQPITAEDRKNIYEVFSAWDKSLPPGELLAEAQFTAFAKQYSTQGIEIFSNQISNVGLPNLRARWQHYAGARMESNELRPLGLEGLGRRAIAWGIGVQAWYPKDSNELQKFDFPWAMILTKEQDDVWRILAIHWGR